MDRTERKNQLEHKSTLEKNIRRFFNWLWKTYYITEYEYYGLTYDEQELFWNEYSLYG